MRPAARFARIVRAISHALQLVAGGVILVAAVAVTINASARYGFGRDLSLITEAGGFIFLIVIFLGLAGTFFAGGHVSVDFLKLLVPAHVANWVQRRLIPWLALGFGLVLTVTGAVMTYRYFDTGRMTIGLVPMPFWIFMAFVPVGSFLFSLALLARILAPAENEGSQADGH